MDIVTVFCLIFCTVTTIYAHRPVFYQECKDYNKLNEGAERQSPAVHPGWSFNAEKDLDLRVVLNDPDPEDDQRELLNEQRAKAFQCALWKINTFIDKVKRDNRCRDRRKVNVRMNDFITTKIDWIYAEDMGRVIPLPYPVEMTTTIVANCGPESLFTVSSGSISMGVPLPIHLLQWQWDLQLGKMITDSLKFPLKIDFDSPRKTEIQGPRGPHIGYEVRERNNKLVGHILINNSTNNDVHLPDRESVESEQEPENYGRVIDPNDHSNYSHTNASWIVTPNQLIAPPNKTKAILKRIPFNKVKEIGKGIENNEYKRYNAPQVLYVPNIPFN